MTASGARRVALMHPWDPSRFHRGTERLVRDLAAGLSARGWSPELLTVKSGAGPEPETVAGIPAIRTRRLPGPGPAVTHLPGTWKAMKRGGYEIAHAFHPADAVLAGRWAKTGRGRGVFTVPAYPPKSRNPLRRRLYADAVERVDAVVAPTESVARAIRAVAPRARVVTIPPGVDTSVFSPGDGRAERPTVFCAAAIGEPRKRVEMLVRAFAEAGGAAGGAALVLADPHGDREMPLWASERGVEVRRIGDDRDLVAAYREAWVTVLPAVDEPFGLVLTESMACGTPVIGADDSGIPEVLGDTAAGTLFPPDDIHELASQLEVAMRTAPSAALAEAAVARAAELTVERTAAAYADLYADLPGGQTL